jgi:hypothetical protein
LVVVLLLEELSFEEPEAPPLVDEPEDEPLGLLRIVEESVLEDEPLPDGLVLMLPDPLADPDPLAAPGEVSGEDDVPPEALPELLGGGVVLLGGVEVDPDEDEPLDMPLLPEDPVLLEPELSPHPASAAAAAPATHNFASKRSLSFISELRAKSGNSRRAATPEVVEAFRTARLTLCGKQYTCR